jgi:hypothetical protein
MKAKWFTTFLVLTMLMVTIVPTVSAASTTHKWKFDPTINAPWALEEDEGALDNPFDAAGLCRSNPFNTVAAYGPLGSNVDTRGSQC